MTADEIKDNAQDPEEWIITLVHGTWGRGKLTLDRPRKSGPRWFEDKSDFRNRLEQNLKDAKVPNFQIESFLWSGANSILERNEAARGLAQRLADQREPKRPIKQIIVAHSHGGNIALRAVELFEGSRDNLFVATMATPFLEIFAPQIWDVSVERKFFAVSLGVTIVLILLLLFPFEVAAMAITPAMLLAFSLVLVGDEIERRRREQEAPDANVDQLADATSRQSLKQNGVELLVLRGIDDEASLTIAAGAIGARFSNVIARLASAVPMRAYMMVFFDPPGARDLDGYPSRFGSPGLGDHSWSAELPNHLAGGGSILPYRQLDCFGLLHHSPSMQCCPWLGTQLLVFQCRGECRIIS
jgi:hypothetical protein